MWSVKREAGGTPERVLVVAPHPDDEVLGCGGTIARLVEAGHHVCVAIVTRGWQPLFAVEQIERVMGEARLANETLGTSELRTMDLPVVALERMAEHELNGHFDRLVREVEPTVALLPFPSDRHEDHRQVFDACMVALRPLPARRALHTVACYETVSETHWAMPYGEAMFSPQLNVDISATLERKLAAMRCYASQLREAPDARSLIALESLARWRGSVVGMHAAESFVLVRGSVF